MKAYGPLTHSVAVSQSCALKISHNFFYEFVTVMHRIWCTPAAPRGIEGSVAEALHHAPVAARRGQGYWASSCDGAEMMQHRQRNCL